jgi:hypothetical protein
MKKLPEYENLTLDTFYIEQGIRAIDNQEDYCKWLELKILMKMADSLKRLEQKIGIIED